MNNKEWKLVRLFEVDTYQGTPLNSVSNEAVDFESVSTDELCDKYILAQSDEELARNIVKILTEKGKTISVAESLTGGLLASAIVEVSGASKAFDFGVVSYSNRSKHTILGVTDKSLKELGAVSKNVACEMAKGVLLNNDYALSTTGIAGPNGDGICEKIGTVFIGLATENDVSVYGFLFEGEREEIRKKTVKTALSILLTKIMQQNM